MLRASLFIASGIRARRPSRGSSTTAAVRALLLVLLAHVTLAAGAFALDTTAGQDAGLLPMPQAVTETWRWRKLARRGQTGTFVAVYPLDNGRLLASDHDGLWIYDGLSWTAAPAGALFADARVVFAAESDSGLVLVTDEAIYGIPEGTGATSADELCLIDGGELGAPTVPTVMPDGRLLAGLGPHIWTLTVDGASDPLPIPDDCRGSFGLGVDADGVLWCATVRGLFLYLDGSWKEADGTEEAGLDIVAAEMTRVVTGDDEVFLLPRISDSRLRGFTWNGTELEPLPRLPANGLLTGAVATPSGDLIVTLRRGDLYLLHADTWAELERPSPFNDPISALGMVGDDRLVLTTVTGDVLICNMGSTRWTVHDPADVDVSSIVNALAPSGRGGVWVGTHEGIARWDGQHFVDASLVAGDLGIPLRSITTVMEDERGHLWVGSGHSRSVSGVLEFDGEQRWIHHASGPLADRHVHKIRRGPEGDLWMLMLPSDSEGVTGGAVVRRSREDGSLTEHEASRAYDIAWPLHGPPVIGHYRGASELLPSGLRRIPGLEFEGGRRAFALHAAPDGDLWVGLGLRIPEVWRRDAVTTEWCAVPYEPTDAAAAAAFARTNDGVLWFTSEAGLFRTDRDGALRVSDGMHGSPGFWPVIVDDTGTGLWLGSLGAGLVHYRPDDRAPPATEEVGTAYAGSASDTVVTAHWLGADAWAETPQASLRYRWQLDGGEWSPPTWERGAKLRDLAPGGHVLEVRTVDGAGNIEPDGQRHDFVVEPPVVALLDQPVVRLGILLLVGLLASLVHVLVRRHRERRLAERSRVAFGRRLRSLTSRLMEAQEVERRRLAKDLHDDLGQVLTAASLHLEQASRQTAPERRAVAIERAQVSLEQALGWVRSVAEQIRPTLLDDLGLEAAVMSTLDDFERRTGIAVLSELALEPDSAPDPTASNHLFRILQECLANAERHAGANRVEVVMRGMGGSIELCVTDDGVGFVPEEEPTGAGMGLLDMRERAESSGGTFRIVSRPQEGAIVQVVIPLKSGENPDEEVSKESHEPWTRSESSSPTTM